jgi:hypothetical protein
LETEHYNSVLEITVVFLGIHIWEPDIYIVFSPALHLQCGSVLSLRVHIPQLCSRRLQRVHHCCCVLADFKAAEPKNSFRLMAYSALCNNVFKALNLFLNRNVAEIQLPSNGIRLPKNLAIKAMLYPFGLCVFCPIAARVL